jgi:WD40 repeat protein
VIGDYELLTEIGRGGMGAVYAARQISLDRLVAVKLILAGHLATPDEIERFQREAEDVARLDHPHIVSVYEISQHGGQHFFSMRLIRGASLTQSLERLRTDPRAAARLLATVARAVHHAHEHGILHRDLKPANILVDVAGQPHITDFGLAKRLDGGTSLSPTGAIVGTASYMAPEQAAAERRLLSPATDVYSLGAVLYEMLTGRPPFQGDNLLETLRQVVERAPEPPRKLNPLVPANLETICLKCLDKRPTRRYPSALALAGDLENWLAGKPIAARPVGQMERLWLWCRRKPALAATLAAAAVLLLAAGGLFVYSLVVGRRASEAQEQRRIEEEEKNRKDEEARQEREARQAQDYRNDMRRAGRAWEEADPLRTRKLLEAYRPQPGGRDFRGCEWYYLDALAPGDELRRLCKTPQGLHALTWSADGKALAGILGEETLKVWEADTAQERLSVPLEKQAAGGINALFWGPDGKRLAGVDDYGRVVVRDSASGRKLYTLEPVPPADRAKWLDEARRGRREYFMRQSVSWSPDGQRFVTTRPELGTAVVCDVDADREVYTVNGQSGKVRMALWSPDGKTILTVEAGAVLKVWDAASSRETFRLPDPQDVIGLAAWKADGREFATLNYDGINDHMVTAVGIWSLADRKERVRISCDHGPHLFSSTLSWSPDGHRLSVSGGPSLMIVDADQGRVVGTPTESERGMWRQLRDNVWPTPDGRFYAVYDTVRSVDTQQAVDALPLLAAPWTPLAWSPDGTRLAVLQSDPRGRPDRSESAKALWLWTPTWPGQPGNNWPLSDTISFTWSPDGRSFVVFPSQDPSKPRAGASEAGALELRIGDPERRRLVTVRNLRLAETVQVRFAALSRDGRLLALACSDQSVQVRDAATGQVRSQFRGHREETTLDTTIFEVSWSPTGKWVTSADTAGRVWVWDPTTGTPKLQVDLGSRPHLRRFRVATWSADEKHLAVALEEGKRLRILDVATGQETRTLAVEEPASIAWRPNSSQLAFVGRAAVQLWDSATGQTQEITRQARGPLDWSPDGRVLVLGSTQHGVRLWYAEEQALGRVPLPFDASIPYHLLQVAWTSDSRCVALYCPLQPVMTFDVQAGKVLPNRLPNLRDRVVGVSLGWTAKGARAALVTRETVEVWEDGKARPLWSLDQPKKSTTAPMPAFRDTVWSPDGRTLATLDSEGTIRLWDPATGKTSLALPATPLELPAGHVVWHGSREARRFATWSPDGKRLARTNAATIEIWDADTGKQLLRMGNKMAAPKPGPPLVPGPLLGPPGEKPLPPPVQALAWSPNGSRLAALSFEDRKRARVTLWDPATGRESLKVTTEEDNQGDGVSALAWSPDGKYFALGNAVLVQAWEAQTGREAFALSAATPEGPLGRTALTWSGDGQRLIAQSALSERGGVPPHLASQSNRLVVWDVQARQEVLTLSGPGAVLLLDPDRRWAYTGSFLKPLGGPSRKPE